MDTDIDAVESSTRAYLAAAQRGDFTALWSLMSRGAQAICVATAKGEGVAAESGPSALEQLMGRQGAPPRGPVDVEVEVESLNDDVAQVKVSSPSRGESDTFVFVLEDGEWKVGVEGLHKPGP